MKNLKRILGALSAHNNPQNNKRHFYKWIRLKKKIHYIGGLPKIHEGEIWWCAIGENVGVEINGKNEPFSRPVLILRKLSKYGFMGIPLTSQEHRGTWYVNFKFKDKKRMCSSGSSSCSKRTSSLPKNGRDYICRSFQSQKWIPPTLLC